eukprot:scaffold41812_cov32-Tisochrysis_lutea.AAC.3
MLHKSICVPCHAEFTQKQIVLAPGRRCRACSCSEEGVIVLRNGRLLRIPPEESKSDERKPSADSPPAKLVGVSRPSGGVESAATDAPPPTNARIELNLSAGKPSRVSAGISASSMSSMLMATDPSAGASLPLPPS